MARTIHFHDYGWEDYLYWQETDKKIIRRINDLLEEIRRTPFTGTGKPEPLRFSMAGCWSRRITGEHRLVYMVKGNEVIVLQCRHHY